jgi:hypothetical protein
VCVVDWTGVKASLGLEDDVEPIGHQELQERRSVLQRRLREGGGAV